MKTAVVTLMTDQLKYWVRGTKGTYLKVSMTRPAFHKTIASATTLTVLLFSLQFGTDPQEAKTIAAPGQPASDANFGVEKQENWGTLTTTAAFDTEHQVLDESTSLYTGKYPSIAGSYRSYYENVVDAIRGKAPVTVKPEVARDGLRVIELARQSHKEGITLPWS